MKVDDSAAAVLDMEQARQQLNQLRSTSSAQPHSR